MFLLQILYAADLTYILSLFLSKISVLCLELRLSPERFHTISVRASLVFSGVVTIASIFMIAFGCNTDRPWLQSTHECRGLVGLLKLLPFAGTDTEPL